MARANRPLFWIANPNRRKTSNPPALASGARAAVGRPAMKTDGSVSAAMNGIHSRPGEFAQRAFTYGLRPSASHAGDGRRIRIGILDDESAI